MEIVPDQKIINEQGLVIWERIHLPDPGRQGTAPKGECEGPVGASESVHGASTPAGSAEVRWLGQEIGDCTVPQLSALALATYSSCLVVFCVVCPIRAGCSFRLGISGQESMSGW